MAIGKARTRAVDSPMICSRTRCELIVVVILAVLTIFLFPSVQGPYSVVRGPATAFRARDRLPSHTRPSCKAQCAPSEILQVRLRWLPPG
jgi:hypothetical protein